MFDMIMKSVIEILVTIFFALVTRYVIPFIKSKVDTNKLSLAIKWASTFVECAEMAIKGESMGKERMAMVTDLLTKKLKELHISISDEELTAIIEKCVFNMKHQ